jgi:hypothetical protein
MDTVRKILLVVLIKFLLPVTVNAQKNSLLNGTIIITLTSKDTIWIGADSRTSALTDTGYTVNKKGMCKIYNTKDVVYAMAGHVRYVDDSFDFSRIMADCINEQQDFDKSMVVFQEKAKDEITSILKKFSYHSINTLIKTNNGAFLSVVAVSFKHGEKKIKEMKFSVDNDWNVIDKATDQDDIGSLRFIGHAMNASEYIKNNKLYFGNGRNIPDKIVELIKLESEKGTVTVGLPADVISIYNNGYKRVITSGLCSE